LNRACSTPIAQRVGSYKNLSLATGRALMLGIEATAL
jgi:hypothetical protein